MPDLAGKTAFVTGGASGIGLALGQAFAQAGMKVMLADIEADALEAAAGGLRAAGYEVRGIVCDVADADSVYRAEHQAFDAFACVHVLCNNAGVAGGGGIDDIALPTWRWVMDVNVFGVLHGIAAFLPHMRAHGEGGHIVNTASMAGLQSGLGFSPLCRKQVCCRRHVEGSGGATGAAGYRRERGVSGLCAHTHRAERAQPAGAVWRCACCRARESGRLAGGLPCRAGRRVAWTLPLSRPAFLTRSLVANSTSLRTPRCVTRWKPMRRYHAGVRPVFLAW